MQAEAPAWEYVGTGEDEHMWQVASSIAKLAVVE
jgi:hypothetical protein